MNIETNTTAYRGSTSGAPAVDPFVDRMKVYAAELKAFNEQEVEPDWSNPPHHKLIDEIEAGTLKITSAAGAAAALQRLVDLDCIIDGEGDLMVEAVMAFLKGRAAQ